MIRVGKTLDDSMVQRGTRLFGGTTMDLFYEKKVFKDEP